VTYKNRWLVPDPRATTANVTTGCRLEGAAATEEPLPRKVQQAVMSSPTATNTVTTGLAAATTAKPGGAALNKVAVFRAAVQGVRKCLELSQAIPTHTDSLCNGFLKIIEGPDPEGQLERFCKVARSRANGDLYMTAVLKALDRAGSEQEAELWVMSSVNEQLMRRASAR